MTDSAESFPSELKKRFDSITSGISGAMKGAEIIIVGEFASDESERRHITMLLGGMARALYFTRNIAETDETIESLRACYDRSESVLHDKGFTIIDYLENLRSQKPLPFIADRLIQARRERRY